MIKFLLYVLLDINFVALEFIFDATRVDGAKCADADGLG